MRIESFLQQSPVFQINRGARRIEAALNRILAGEDVTLFEALILAALFFEKKGNIKPSDLAATFQTTRGNVSHCLSSLEAKGLVRRRIDSSDARAFRLMLLPPGRRRAARVAGVLDRMQAHLETTIGAVKLETMVEQLCAVEELCSRLADTVETSDRRSIRE